MDILKTPNQERNNALRPIIGLFLVILLACASFFMIMAGINKIKENKYVGQDVQKKNSITITGEGKIFAKPDIGQIDLSVLSEAAAVAAAQKDNTDKMNKIVDAVKNAGVDEKDLKTTGYSISPNYQYTAGKSILIGYQVSQTLEAKVRNPDNLGTILARATENGANQIGSLTFTFDDPEGLKAQARQEAIKNARNKANDLAAALDVKLVRIIDFSETASPEPTPIYNYKEASGMGGGPTPDIQTGQNEITADVEITYEIE
jgi:hypothetical protein